MSRQYDSMQRLLKKQEEERADLMNAAYLCWLEVKQNERNLLADFDGHYEKAFPEIKEQINEGRQSYFKVWGAEGELAAIMAERQEKDRKKLVEQLSVREQLQSYYEDRNNRNKDKDKDHDR